MPSTYVNDLRIEEQATGENSGTWGTKLNAALSQISEGFGYGTKQLAGDADETFTMPDGTSDGTRAIYLKITSAGSLTATRVVTLGPNTVSKLWIIENATTGSQSINIKQGSGATVTIPNGQNKVLYSDGAGSGAAIVDAFRDLSLPSLYVSGNVDVDGTANLDVVDIDGAVDMASTLTVADDLAVDTDTLFVDASTDRVGIGLTAPSNVLHIKDSNPTIRIEDSDGSGAGIAQIQNTANGNLRLIADPNNDGSSSSSIEFEIDGSEKARFGATGRLGIGTTSPSYVIDAQEATDPSIRVMSTGTASTDDAFVRIQIGGSSAKSLLYFGDTDSSSSGRLRYDHSDDSLEIFTNATEAMHITSAQDIGLGGTPSAGYRLDVIDSGATSARIRSTGDYETKLFFYGNGTTATNSIYFGDTGNTAAGSVRYFHNGDNLTFNGKGTGSEMARFNSSGQLGIGTSSPSQMLHVAGIAQVDTGVIFGGSPSYLYESATDNVNLRIGSDGPYIEFIDVGSNGAEIGNSSGFLALTSGGAEKMRIATDGKVGINKTAPAYELDVDSTIHIGNDGGSGFTHSRLIFDANGAGRGIGSFYHNQANDVEWFQGNPYNASDSWSITRQATASHADSTANVTNALMSVDSAGNVLIGGTTTPSSSAGNIVLHNGTAPSGSATNGIVLYAEDVSSSSELKVRDEAGNVTTLSPHNFELCGGPSEDMAWSYFSERDGKRINVDMLKAIRVLEQISGEKLVFEN